MMASGNPEYSLFSFLLVFLSLFPTQQQDVWGGHGEEEKAGGKRQVTSSSLDPGGEDQYNLTITETLLYQFMFGATSVYLAYTLEINNINYATSGTLAFSFLRSEQWRTWRNL